MTDIIEVVAACLSNDDGEFFVAQRVRSPDGAWEMPGGKVEPGESPQVALHRELWEELGVFTYVEGLIVRTPILESSKGRFVVSLYRVRLREKEVPVVDQWVHHQHAWMSLEQLQSLGASERTLSLPFFLAELARLRERQRVVETLQRRFRYTTETNSAGWLRRVATELNDGIVLVTDWHRLDEGNHEAELAVLVRNYITAKVHKTEQVGNGGGA